MKIIYLCLIIGITFVGIEYALIDNIYAAWWVIITLLCMGTLDCVEEQLKFTRDLLKEAEGKIETTEYLRRYIVDGKDNE